ncbi:hypothetical protein [Puniceicoccus vermicola]|uniref:Uncharacterized protein n=1 Tax=Puniceicoccus vermicola TaxID=388746 RepID=A0A7X1B0U5_9BACT|nr:hypothetical protein [Puniceicoccus vermicola]MBC2603550.1 hypothetical protein [Puniceicoccus vermicola]
MRALIEPNLAPGENVDDRISYTGEDGSDQNAPYTSALEKFVAESVLCSCVDTYHWYLRRVFQTALTADMSRIDTWKGTLKLSKKRIHAVKDATDLGPAISAIFRGSEEPFRVLAHEFLNVPDLAIIPKAVVVRNCLVHELGEDRSGKVAAAISVENDLGVSIHNNIVPLPIQEAYEISGRFISDISIMDQALANVLHLPTDRSPLPTFSRAYS